MITTAPLVEEPRPIYRVSAGETRLFHILSDRVTGVNTHWFGRSYLCIGAPDCPACFAGVEQRWTGYLPVADHRGNRGLLEISASGGELWERRLSQGKLFDSVAKIERPSRFACVRVAELRPAAKPVGTPIEPEEAYRWLMRILGMPARRPNEQFPEWVGRVRVAAQAALQRCVGDRNLASE